MGSCISKKPGKSQDHGKSPLKQATMEETGEFTNLKTAADNRYPN
jgi:hypothetical protein